MATEKSRNVLAYLAIGIGIAAIAISIAVAAIPSQSTVQVQPPAPQTREFYLFTEVDQVIEEEEDTLKIPPDMFSLKEITVNKGDTVVIHFYNLEAVDSQEHHTFTMAAPYEMNVDLNAGEEKTFQFVANETGVFEYQCVFHTPTMRGQLVVLG